MSQMHYVPLQSLSVVVLSSCILYIVVISLADQVNLLVLPYKQDIQYISRGLPIVSTPVV